MEKQWVKSAEDEQDKLFQRMEDVDRWFSSWMQKLPRDQQESIVEVVDQLIFYLSNWFQQKSKIEDVESRILIEGRIFNADLESISDMRHLPINHLEYIEEKYKSKYSLYSMIQGGISGVGHPLLLLFDFPALLGINIKQIHYIASTYGYSLRFPPEQILALKVLHAATLSKTYHDEAWEWMLSQYQQEDEYSLHIREDETIIQPEWLETLAKQWIKALVLFGMKKASSKNIPILGVAMGANLNYQFTKQTAQFASRFYKYRYKQERTQHEIRGLEDE